MVTYRLHALAKNLSPLFEESALFALIFGEPVFPGKPDAISLFQGFLNSPDHADMLRLLEYRFRTRSRGALGGLDVDAGDRTGLDEKVSHDEFSQRES